MNVRFDVQPASCSAAAQHPARLPAAGIPGPDDVGRVAVAPGRLPDLRRLRRTGR